MGVIGKEKRMKTYLPDEITPPGPGAYNIEVFKSLSKGELSQMAST